MLQQFGVIKCSYFEENNQAIIMDSDCCCTILETFLATEHQGIRQRVGKTWFQEDGATIHNSYLQMLVCD
jgi:hypothetical protein